MTDDVTNEKLSKLREVRGKYASIAPTPDTWQQRIYAATEARGYAADWTPEQFAARQVIKAVEELAELVAHVRGVPIDFAAIRRVMRDAGDRARVLFDNTDAWGGASVMSGADTEAADVAVTLANFAVAWGFDLLRVAESKATADIERGKRAE